jgi:hypothetical protein
MDEAQRQQTTKGKHMLYHLVPISHVLEQEYGCAKGRA